MGDGSITAIDWVQLVGLLVGFTLTGIQLKQTKSAAESARDAIGATEYRLAVNMVLMTVPTLQSLESEITLAIDQGKRAEAVRLLMRWQQLCSDLRGLLADDVYTQETKLLSKSAVLAAQAVTKLVDAPEATSLVEPTSALRSQMAQTTHALGALAGSLRRDPKGAQS